MRIVRAVSTPSASTWRFRRSSVAASSSSSIHPAVEEGSIFKKNITFLQRVTTREVVVLSTDVDSFPGPDFRLRIFRLFGIGIRESDVRKAMTEIADDLQGGSLISKALEKHPKIFSGFYVNMVKAGEESGKLDQIFLYLADYMERNYEVSSKATNALIYPAFVIFTFIVVMLLMFTVVIPKIGAIISQSGQQLPLYTQIVIGISSFLLHYGNLSHRSCHCWRLLSGKIPFDGRRQIWF